LYGKRPANIIAGLEVRVHMEIILPGPVRDIDEIGTAGIELDGGDDAGRSSKVCSIYGDDDVVGRRGEME